MIRVAAAPEPEGFHLRVRVPGRRAIAEMCGKAPPFPREGGRPFAQRRRAAGNDAPLITAEEDLPFDAFQPYWTSCLAELKDAYAHVCAYSCFRIHPVTGAASVDHFAAKSRAWDRVYEWDNYRLACTRMNARKRDFGDVLDPFDVDDEWFQLDLVGFQVLAAFGLPIELARRVEGTIERLGLDDFRADRERDAVTYWDGDVSLAWLRRESPFVARELARQGRLRPGDR